MSTRMSAYDAQIMRQKLDAALKERAQLHSAVDDLLQQVIERDRQIEQLQLELARMRPKAQAVDAAAEGLGKFVDSLLGRRAGNVKRRRS